MRKLHLPPTEDNIASRFRVPSQPNDRAVALYEAIDTHVLLLHRITSPLQDVGEIEYTQYLVLKRRKSLLFATVTHGQLIDHGNGAFHVVFIIQEKTL